MTSMDLLCRSSALPSRNERKLSMRYGDEKSTPGRLVMEEILQVVGW